MLTRFSPKQAIYWFLQSPCYLHCPKNANIFTQIRCNLQKNQSEIDGHGSQWANKYISHSKCPADGGLKECSKTKKFSLKHKKYKKFRNHRNCNIRKLSVLNVNYLFYERLKKKLQTSRIHCLEYARSLVFSNHTCEYFNGTTDATLSRSNHQRHTRQSSRLHLVNCLDFFGNETSRL